MPSLSGKTGCGLWNARIGGRPERRGRFCARTGESLVQSKLLIFNPSTLNPASFCAGTNSGGRMSHPRGGLFREFLSRPEVAEELLTGHTENAVPLEPLLAAIKEEASALGVVFAEVFETA